jgi:hypothetical protein
MSTKETEGENTGSRFYPSQPPLIPGRSCFFEYFFLPLNLGGDVDEGDRGGRIKDDDSGTEITTR